MPEKAVLPQTHLIRYAPKAQDTQRRGNRPPHPRPGGAPTMSRGPASVAILLLFYFFNFENYNLYFHDQMPRAAGWNRGGGINSTILATLCCTKAFSNLQAWKRK